MPPTIWSARRWIESTACSSAISPPERIADEQAEPPRVELVGGEDGEEGAHQHHPLEADVDDAGALAEHPAERAEDERRRVAEHRGEQRRPDDDVLELAEAGAAWRGRRARSRARPPRSRSRRTAARRGSARRCRGRARPGRARGSTSTSGPRSAAAPPRRRRGRARCRSRRRCEGRGAPARPTGRAIERHAGLASAHARHQPEDDDVGADEQHDEALDQQRQVGRELGLEDSRDRGSASTSPSGARRRAARRARRRPPCCGRGARPRCR